MSQFGGFSTVKLKRPQRSSFDLTHDKRLTTNMGRLTPVLSVEAIPGDVFSGSTEILLRLLPLLAPIYDQIQLFVHFYFVPMRLLWEEWETFITGGRLGVGIDPLVAPLPPYLDIGLYYSEGHVNAFVDGSLADYMGVPNFPGLGASAWNGIRLDVAPFAAFQKIYMDYYRDRNFVADDLIEFPLPSGEQPEDVITELLSHRTRSYLHDYFTSALPFTQRGEEVLMPVELGGNAPLYVHPLGGAGFTASLDGHENPGGISVGYGLNEDYSASDGKLFVKGDDFDGTSTSVNDFRTAYALQVWLERNAVGGSRYTESTYAHFGVKPQDSRLQRAEYLGGGRIGVQVTEVVSTAWSVDAADQTVPLANMGGHGVAYGNTNSFRYFCPEHGFIIGVASIMNPPSYKQGLPRMFHRRSFLDYPWPTFAKLGEQEVHNWEIFADDVSMVPDGAGKYPLFGYQSRYADWKYVPSTNHSNFRNTLGFWSLTRQFADQPVLSKEFNEFDIGTQQNIFVAPPDNSEPFLLYVHNKLTVKRALPYFGTPNTLGFD